MYIYIYIYIYSNWFALWIMSNEISSCTSQRLDHSFDLKWFSILKHESVEHDNTKDTCFLEVTSSYNILYFVFIMFRYFAEFMRRDFRKIINHSTSWSWCRNWYVILSKKCKSIFFKKKNRNMDFVLMIEMKMKISLR